MGARPHCAKSQKVNTISSVTVSVLHIVYPEHDVGGHIQYKSYLTPLHLASLHRRSDITRMLLDHGATVNPEACFGQTPLHLVAEGRYNFEQDRIRIVQLLLKHGADINARDEDNATPLHVASRYGRVAIARVLLDGGATANSKDDQGRTPLHSVAERYCIYSKNDGARVARLLLERGADVSAPDENNGTPLHLASYYGKVEIVRVLLDGSALANSKDSYGRTSLHKMAGGGYCYAYGRGDDVIPVAQLLLERGADVNMPDDIDRTPLHLASDAGEVDMVRVLLNAGANASAMNAWGQTPLHLVVLRVKNRILNPDGHGGDYTICIGVAQLLLRYGADVNAQDTNHVTPLALASFLGSTEIASLLLGSKTNPKIDQPPSPRQLGPEGVQFRDEH